MTQMSASGYQRSIEREFSTYSEPRQCAYCGWWFISRLAYWVHRLKHEEQR